MPDDVAARVAADPGLRRVLGAARAWGVSPSRFMGAATSTVHQHDAAGRLVRSTQASEWTDEDRALALALLDYEADQCPGCAGPLAETTAPENEERYRAELAALCHRCVALAQARDRHAEHPHAGALLITARLQRPEPESSGEG